MGAAPALVTPVGVVIVFSFGAYYLYNRKKNRPATRHDLADPSNDQDIEIGKISRSTDENINAEKISDSSMTTETAKKTYEELMCALTLELMK